MKGAQQNAVVSCRAVRFVKDRRRLVPAAGHNTRHRWAAIARWAELQFGQCGATEVAPYEIGDGTIST
jgi:hypothetical protein